MLEIVTLIFKEFDSERAAALRHIVQVAREVSTQSSCARSKELLIIFLNLRLPPWVRRSRFPSWKHVLLKDRLASFVQKDNLQ